LAGSDSVFTNTKLYGMRVKKCTLVDQGRTPVLIKITPRSKNNEKTMKNNRQKQKQDPPIPAI
jgi:hypothetical protein